LHFVSLLNNKKEAILENKFWQKRGDFYGSIVLVFVLLVTTLQTWAVNLSEQAQISIITCSPGNEAYSVYGHSAIRVKDEAYNYDAVFNYGIFDFSAPNFLYRFAKGETDYKLGVNSFNDFVNHYIHYKRSVFEQVLDLSQTEKQKMFDFLLWNAKPENRVYRYNFFFDNCASRIRDVVNDNVEGGITFKEENRSGKTLRTMVDEYHGKLLWLTFGIDLIVSSESDREATFWEEMFLPDYLMKHFAEAVKTKDNTRLVKKTTTIYEAPVNTYKSLKIVSPFVVLLVLTLLLAFFSFRQYRQKKMKSALDYIVYGLNGFMGLVMAWFALFSEHPAMSPNYNLLWALALNLVFVFVLLLFSSSKISTCVFSYGAYDFMSLHSTFATVVC
jgi:hypothetical protein